MTISPGIWFLIPGVCTIEGLMQNPGFSNQKPGCKPSRNPDEKFCFCLYFSEKSCRFNLMPARSEAIIRGNTYHFYNRGVNKGPIFFSHRNYQYFLYKLGHYLDQKASIYAYCLMPNHYHLLVKVISEDFTRSGLQPLLGAYSKAVNQEQGRVGPLFQGRFQANLIGNDEQLLDCVRYIHQNPVEAGIVKSPAEWEYSSYRVYFAPTVTTFVDTGYVMKFFDNIGEFIAFSVSGGN